MAQPRQVGNNNDEEDAGAEANTVDARYAALKFSEEAGIESAGSIVDYNVLKAIGKGKFSVVYRAVHKETNKVVALKRIAIVDITDERQRLKTLKEVRLLQRLDHPNIIKYLDAFIDEHDLVIVFEWAEAGDLKRQLRKATEKKVRFDERLVWRYFAQICEAIQYMHQIRVMHRDLKPANIFLTSKGEVKVGDLGLSRALSDNTMQAHSKVGTPLYMSPEVLRGKGYAFKSDVWSLGCILYELAVLRSPFKEEGLSLYGLFQKINAGKYPVVPSPYSEELRDLVRQMLDVDVTKRATIDEVCRMARHMKAKTEAAREARRRRQEDADQTDETAANAKKTPGTLLVPGSSDSTAVVDASNRGGADERVTAKQPRGNDARATTPERGGGQKKSRRRKDRATPHPPREPEPEKALNMMPRALGTPPSERKRRPPKPPPSSAEEVGGGSSSSNAAMATSILLMEEAVEKMKLLGDVPKDSETKYLRMHFAIDLGDAGHSRHSQFRAFVSLCAELLAEAGHPLEHAEEVLGGLQSPLYVVRELLNGMVAAGFPADAAGALSAQALARGYGHEACTTLNWLLDQVLLRRKFRWKRIKYPFESDVLEFENDEASGMLVTEDTAAKDDGSGIEENVDLPGGDTEVGEMVLHVRHMDRAADSEEEEDGLGEAVDPLLWQAEMERVGPRLKQAERALHEGRREAVGQSVWRSHLESAKRHAATVRSLLPDTSSSLRRIANTVEEDVQRIANGERTLVRDHEHAASKFCASHGKLQVLRDLAEDAQATVRDRMEMLTRLVEDLDDVKETMDSRGKSMTDTSPLVRIKQSIKDLTAEIADMSLRAGVIRQQLFSSQTRAEMEKKK